MNLKTCRIQNLIFFKKNCVLFLCYFFKDVIMKNNIKKTNAIFGAEFDVLPKLI